MLQQEYIDSLLNCLLNVKYVEGMLNASENIPASEALENMIVIKKNIDYLIQTLKDLYKISLLHSDINKFI